MPVFVVDADGAVRLTVHVQPGAARAGIAGRHGDALKVRVSAAPERGRANTALERLLAGELGVRASEVEVVAGRSARRKQVRISGVDADRVTRWLAGHSVGPGTGAGSGAGSPTDG